MKWRVNGPAMSNGLGGTSRDFLCASARVSPEFGLLCAQVACVVFFGPGVFTPESTLSLIAGWRRMEFIIAVAFKRYNSASL
jgi:hypothetical protein